MENVHLPFLSFPSDPGELQVDRLHVKFFTERQESGSFLFPEVLPSTLALEIWESTFNGLSAPQNPSRRPGPGTIPQTL